MNLKENEDMNIGDVYRGINHLRRVTNLELTL
jgi:hypothetical protein